MTSIVNAHNSYWNNEMSTLLTIRPYDEDLSRIRGNLNISATVRKALMNVEKDLPAAVQSAMQSQPPEFPDQLAMSTVTVNQGCIDNLNAAALKTGLPKDAIVRLLLRRVAKIMPAMRTLLDVPAMGSDIATVQNPDNPIT
jgi:hypothetical protein